MKPMLYKGYRANFEYDDDAKIFHGEVMDLKDVITFQGASVQELEKEFHASLDDYFAFCSERGEEPEKPFSGKLILRMRPELHKKLSIEAHKNKRSINGYINDVLNQKVK